MYTIKRPPEERFWEKVNKTEICWEWMGYRDRTGYGSFGYAHQHNKMAHRYSWEIHFGEIPQGLKVLHHCDNPPCVRPDHLFVGTQIDNINDMMSKGRKAVGVDSGVAKLTEDQVKYILNYPWRRKLHKELAAELGVAVTTVNHVRRRKSWKHIESPSDKLTNHYNRLTEDEVREIRRLYAGGEIFQKTLADKFGTTQAHISDIVRREIWADLI